MALRMENKVAYITGAGSGIGKATALKCSQEGATVICADYDENGAKATADEIAKAGGQVMVSKVDISNQDQVKASIQEALKKYGRIDVMIAAAGVGSNEKFDDVSSEDWEKMIKINLTGNFYLLQAIHPVMREQGAGSIVLFSSTADYSGGTGMNPAYVAAKSGVNGLSRHCAALWTKEGIRVNTVMPSWVVTNFNKAAKDTDGVAFDEKENQEWYKNGTANWPMKRPSTPEEMANAAFFLASDEASYISGINLLVAGARYVFNQ